MKRKGATQEKEQFMQRERGRGIRVKNGKFKNLKVV